MLKSLRSLDRVLRGEATRLSSLRSGTIELPIPGVSLLLILLGMIYGVCMGVFSITGSGSGHHMQIVASTVKVPLLFVATLIVTFPSLYVFNTLVGSRLRFGAVIRLMLASLAVTMAVLASLGPIVAFFSVSSTSYAFVLLLNVATFAVAGGLGMAFLLHTLNRMTLVQALPVAPPPMPEAGDITPETPEMPTPSSERELGAIDAIEGQSIVSNVRRVFRIWVLLFGVVGAQMAWVLRPFIGSPGVAFAWFRPRGSSFFEAVWTTIRGLFGTSW
ncbi:MAG: hypothetical protein QM770_16220 [Tepidisphaeraceae bacterium]